MNSKPQSQTVGVSPLSRREKKIKELIEKRAGHQAIIAMGPKGHVKFFRSNDVGGQVRKVRHGNHEKVHVYGVWWCQNELAANDLKKRLDGLLADTYEPSEGAGFYQMAVPDYMVKVSVELAAGETGVMIATSEERETWLLEQAKERAKKVPRGL